MSEPVPVRVPQLNPNDEHAVIVRWHVQAGAQVRAGEPLVTLETTKVTFDVDAPADGYAFFDREPNTDVAVGAPVAWIADTDRPLRLPAAGSDATDARGAEPAERFTRKARKLLKERGLTEADFPGSGRVDAAAVERHAAKRGAPERAAQPRALAGVRPLELTSSKILEIRTLQRVRAEAVPSTVTVALAGAWLDERLRRAAVDGDLVSPLELTLYEVARLLREWPELNGFYADGRAWTYETIAIGFAVNLGRGLRVPVVKDAASLSLRDTAGAVRALSLRYLRDELGMDDVLGGTFTVTDLSGEGVVHFVPVLNERQSAILGLCSARSDGSRELVLTFDHRLSDGMRAGRFLAALRDRLEGPRV
jgi:2-oxoglutarate dehydrogenase E2 component (dihydrolipoamide succinyltransferase)